MNGPVDFETKLKGMSVLQSSSGARLGTISNLVVNPADGGLLGIVMTRPDKEARAIAIGDVHLGDDAAMVADGSFLPVDFSGAFAGGALATELIGAKIVTEDGRLLGRVTQVHVRPEPRGVVYRVAESALQRVFGGGFYISGAYLKAYSREGKRMIVPLDVKEKHAKKSLKDV